MKKNTVKKSVVAVALATSLLASTNVGFASSSLQNVVDQARKDMKEAAYAYVVPAQKGKIATSKDLYPALNKAKANYAKAKNAIVKSNAKNKNVLLKELEDLHNERITKGIVPYIDAYNYADKYLNPILAAIKVAEAEKDWAKVEKLYHQLSVQLKSRTVILYRFTGKAPRDLLLDQYKEPANAKRDQLMVPVTIYMKVVEAEKLIAAGKKEEAAKVVESIKPLLDKVPSTSSLPMMKELLEKVAALNVAPADEKDTVSLRILGTSDIHTNIVNYDYYKDTVSNSLGLAKTATLIKNARKENSNTLLFDNGDAIQGTPLGSYKQSVDKLVDGEEHPSVTAMELLGYDGATMGNHEFNYGLDYLDEVMDDANFPYVNANVRDAASGKLLYKPYVLIDKEVVDSEGKKSTIKVGVTGIVPPQILKWDKTNLEGKVKVDDSVQAVSAVVPDMQKAGADVIVVLSHSGMGDATHEVGEEDVTYLLTKVKGVDAIITGHAHQVFPGKVDASLTNVNIENGTMNGVPVVMPGKFGSHLGVIDLKLKKSGDDWKVVSSKAEVRTIAKDATDVDQSVVNAVKEAHEGTITYVRKAVGKTTADIHSYFSQVQDDPSIQIVTDAQTAYVKAKLKGTANESVPVLSAGAPFKAGTRSDPEYYTYVPKGELAIKNVADLYLYDNTVATVKLTGADVKEWLEMSAGQFNQIDPAKTGEQQLINTDFRSYNYDVIDGVTYEIDVTQPAKYDADGNLVNKDASRIVNLQYNGKPIDLKQAFIVATNNYRASGTFPGVRNATEIEIHPDENREIIIDYILAEQTIDPSADGNWKFAALPAKAHVVFESSKQAEKVLPADGNIKYIGEGTDGFGKYSIK
ncbi:bifunctional 2',3'-cyclic-nucleotide 2'-phosphodiesterase/3'-nucleotidase [Psychrobacillus sp. NEAU-3TGS]|uniref:bifunctional 2',3'-cyclic-nucleotide 2'-phosphodiesterase/3'-nucleotidase n=1 Tax=Psychrobacillus sp. NEAU-3TGS TaxID=2995412 RepID=UPI0024999851|nr:bifunctional 2',3'-cyclic-nucleotide 2'-phosphodiesterase/3'-nucleotidase [Psychrobacillus sp. NEAU-3TGS]MDI2587692.1 bifunctional 2',3'-cyclic-nucleotide 2'-phosphodiesterase/3'-nucleotidase [Psychrobacillus sp. NEAU-3TGS]